MQNHVNERGVSTRENNKAIYRLLSLTLCQQDILQRLALFSVREHCAIDQVRQQLE
jgi:hypothetical protein